MICKNCIHYDVCNYHIDEETSMTVNECGRFMHKDQYVLLPVYVGQPKVELRDRCGNRVIVKIKVEDFT